MAELTSGLRQYLWSVSFCIRSNEKSMLNEIKCDLEDKGIGGKKPVKDSSFLGGLKICLSTKIISRP